MDVSEIVQQDADRRHHPSGQRFQQIFPGVLKPLIAMAHIPALPGTPLYSEAEGVRGLARQVRRDVAVLVDAGFDAVMFCNENDRPYTLKADLASAAVMARVVTECAPQSVPFGVDYLWDAECALGVAVATEARFIREVATGVWESDMGLWSPDAASLLRRRRALDADDLAIFMNVTPEFAVFGWTSLAHRGGAVGSGVEPSGRHLDLGPHGGGRAELDHHIGRASRRPHRGASPAQHRGACRQHRRLLAGRRRVRRRQLAQGRWVHMEPGGPGTSRRFRACGAGRLNWPMGELLLGVDLGTTATKVTLFDPGRGAVAAGAAATRHHSEHAGWSEADTRDGGAMCATWYRKSWRRRGPKGRMSKGWRAPAWCRPSWCWTGAAQCSGAPSSKTMPGPPTK